MSLQNFHWAFMGTLLEPFIKRHLHLWATFTAYSTLRRGSQMRASWSLHGAVTKTLARTSCNLHGALKATFMGTCLGTFLLVILLGAFMGTPMEPSWGLPFMST